jgi:hypothetical protein
VHTIIAQENINRQSYNLKRFLIKSAGAFFGGTMSYAILFKVVPWLSSIKQTQNNYQILLKAASWGIVVGSSYVAAEYAWSFTPEGIVAQAENCVRKYEEIFSKLSANDEDFYSELKHLFKDSSSSLLAAFRYMNTARVELISVRNNLEKLGLGQQDSLNHTVDILVPKIKQFIVISEKSLDLIIHHPDWTDSLSAGQSK